MLYLFSSKDRSKLAIQYVDQESLFRCLSQIMDDIDRKLTKETSKIENWTDAKEMISQLFQSEHPEFLVQTKFDDLISKYDCLSSSKRGDMSYGSVVLTSLNEYQTHNESYVVLLYAYAIIHYLFMTQKGNKAVIRTKGAITKQLSDYTDPNSFVSLITKAINNGINCKMIVNDYDYIANKQIETTKEEEENAEVILSNYKNDPIYGQCYEGVIDGLTALCINNSGYLDIQNIVNIFKEAEKNVDRVLNSNLKEIEIMRVHSEIINRSRNIENTQGNVAISIVTPERIIGFLINQVFLIVLWDKMKDRSSYTKQFEDCRSYINYLNDVSTYKGNPLWKLLAERLPIIKERPRIEDLEVENANLREQIANQNKRSLSFVTNLMNKIIIKLSSDPNNLKDADKAQFISEVSGYKDTSIASCLTKQKKNELMPNEEELENIEQLLSRLSIKLK